MKSRLDKALRKAFERERKREEADPTIPAQRAEIMKRLAEADRRRAEEQRQAEEERRAEAQRADAANARLLSFQSSRPKPIPEPASVPKFGKLVDPKTCPHLLTSYGHCEQCGESVIQGDGVVWYRKKHG